MVAIGNWLIISTDYNITTILGKNMAYILIPIFLQNAIKKQILQSLIAGRYLPDVPTDLWTQLL